MSAVDPVRDAHTEEVRRRQRARARMMGWALAAFVVLTFLITIVRMGEQG